MRIGLTRKLPLPADEDLTRLLSPYFDKINIYERGRPLSEEELKHVVFENDVVICQLTDRLKEQWLEDSAKLKHLVTFSVGTDHIPWKALSRRGIRVSHTPGILTEATADLAWTLILACARRVREASVFLERGLFPGFDPNLFLGRELNGGVLGILGMGKIGTAVARRGLAFGMSVIHDTRGKEGPYGVSVSFDELLQTSDVLSLHCPLTPETRALFTADRLRQMKPDAILVNTARGPIIEEKALSSHLAENPMFYAGLDVFEQEPLVEKTLFERPNALCLPHLGSATRKTRGRMAQICVEEAIRFAKGEPLQYEYSN